VQSEKTAASVLMRESVYARCVLATFWPSMRAKNSIMNNAQCATDFRPVFLVSGATDFWNCKIAPGNVCAETLLFVPIRPS